MSKGKAKAAKQVPVSQKALIARINRRLDERGGRLLAARNASVRLEMGDFYVVDTRSHRGANDTHVDIEELGRELGALKAWERLAEGKAAAK